MRTTNNTAWFATMMAAMLLSWSAALHADVVADAPFTADLNGSVSIVQGAGGSITVSFAAQSPTAIPKYNAVTVVARTSSGENAFAGNYIQAGVESVNFTVRSETTVTQAAGVYLVLRSGVSGRVWRNANVATSTEQGVEVANHVSFDRSSGWTRDGGGDLDAMWAEDLQSVEIIGLRVSQPAREAVSCTIASFTISGTLISTPAVLTALEQALKDKFGVISIDLLTDAQKALDSDGDGMGDFVELASENDDAYANSIFVAEIVSITDAGILIRWPCVAASRYTVLRSSSLLEPFGDLQGAISVLTTTTGYMTYLDTSAGGVGPYFYKIRREP